MSTANQNSQGLVTIDLALFSWIAVEICLRSCHKISRSASAIDTQRALLDALAMSPSLDYLDRPATSPLFPLLSFLARTAGPLPPSSSRTLPAPWTLAATSSHSSDKCTLLGSVRCILCFLPIWVERLHFRSFTRRFAVLTQIEFLQTRRATFSNFCIRLRSIFWSPNGRERDRGAVSLRLQVRLSTSNYAEDQKIFHGKILSIDQQVDLLRLFFVLGPHPHW